jgi:hypothetical protein
MRISCSIHDFREPVMHYHCSGGVSVLAVCPAYLIKRVSEEIDNVKKSCMVGYEVERI